MRTTLTLDDDVAAQLEQLRMQQQRPLKQLVNEALRAGLLVLERPEHPRQGPFTSPVDLGRSRLPDLDDVSEALALLEGDDHR